MKHAKSRTVIILLLGITALAATPVSAVETQVSAVKNQAFRIWPDLAPGEKSDEDGPRLYLFQPDEKTSDTIILICPGGSYNRLAMDHEGCEIAEFFNRKGMTAAVLQYRVPRREGLPKHMAAWQDAQRAVRVVRSKATAWGVDPEKIGIMGFSAGGHLALMTASTSQTPSYLPLDELDQLPCHVNFAVPVYPAYVLQDGANGPNKGRGNDSELVEEFAFDDRTPPMCLIHGDNDQYSAMGSVAVYRKLRTMDIPAELHIFAKTGHGFGARPTYDLNNHHTGDWMNRAYEAIRTFGFASK